MKFHLYSEMAQFFFVSAYLLPFFAQLFEQLRLITTQSTKHCAHSSVAQLLWNGWPENICCDILAKSLIIRTLYYQTSHQFAFVSYMINRSIAFQNMRKLFAIIVFRSLFTFVYRDPFNLFFVANKRISFYDFFFYFYMALTSRHTVLILATEINYYLH